MKAQNQSLHDIPFTAMFGVWGSWLGLLLNVLCMISQFYIAISPLKGGPTAYNFFVKTLAAPVVLGCFIFWKFFHKTYFVRAEQADLFTGRRELDLAKAKEEERLESEARSWWGRYLRRQDKTDITGCITGCAEAPAVVSKYYPH